MLSRFRKVFSNYFNKYKNLYKEAADNSNDRAERSGSLSNRFPQLREDLIKDSIYSYNYNMVNPIDDGNIERSKVMDNIFDNLFEDNPYTDW